MMMILVLMLVLMFLMQRDTEEGHSGAAALFRTARQLPH
jgi:hypothetical protein